MTLSVKRRVDSLYEEQKKISTNIELKYERTKKILIYDHYLVSRFLMVNSIIVMLFEVGYGAWALWDLSSHCNAENSIESYKIIYVFHWIKIVHNLMVIFSFIGKLRDKMPDQPLSHIATYITMSFTWVCMIACKDSLSQCVPPIHLYLLGSYTVVDLFKIFFCFLMLKNLVRRKNIVI